MHARRARAARARRRARLARLLARGPGALRRARSRAGPSTAATPGGTRHSPLTQITPENVRALEVAWTHHSGDIEDGSHGMGMRSSFQATPILVGDTLYFCTPFNRVIALDAESGAERWSYDPHASREGVYNLNCRGVASWVDSRAPDGATCRTRIFTGTLDARLIALDAETGAPCAGLRRRRHRRPARGDRRHEARGVRRDLAARRARRPRDHGRARARQPPHRRAGRRGARVGCAHGRARVGVGSGAAGQPRVSGRVRARVPARHGQCVDGVLGRPRVRPRLRAHGQHVARLLRRPARRPRLLLELGRRARRRHRSRALALPHRAPRPLGLRRALAARVPRLPRERRRGSRADPGHQDGPPVLPRSAQRRAAVPRRGAPGSAGRRARRDAVADAAVPAASPSRCTPRRSRPTTRSASRPGTAASAAS